MRATNRANGISIVNSAISTTVTNHAHEARDVANITKRVFEDAGLSTDSQRAYDIAITLTAAATATGTVSAVIHYVVD